MNSKGPCYGWRWKRSSELWHPTDFLAIGDELDDQVKNKCPGLTGQYVGRHGWAATPIDPGEGYRLLGWDEQAKARNVSVTNDGLKWRAFLVDPIEVEAYGNDLVRPSDCAGIKRRKWLAARVPVERDLTCEESERCYQAIAEAECRTWNEAIEAAKWRLIVEADRNLATTITPREADKNQMLHRAAKLIETLKKGAQNGTEND